METGNDKQRLLSENLPDAFAYHRIVTDGNGSMLKMMSLVLR